MDYTEFLKTKQIKSTNHGFEIDKSKIHPMLFDFQKDLVLWAIKKGKVAMFAATGLGKTFIQLEWARLVQKKISGIILIIAPLAVAKQTIKEAGKINVNDLKFCRNNTDLQQGINITNYEMIHAFDFDKINGIALDESSILKSFAGVYRNELINKTRNIKYKLACTATPAPNDYMELGNHSEFLGELKRREMLATFFINDCKQTQKWRLKGHSINDFWKWISSWAAVINHPRDLDYDQDGYDLPPLRIHEHIVKSKKKIDSFLFKKQAETLSERRSARKITFKERISKAEEIVNRNPDEKFLIWCDLNIESETLAKKIKNSVEVKGTQDIEIKEDRLLGFAENKYQTLVTKPKIAGFGLNFQKCHNVIFCGLSDSFEQYYQAVRRCWRFGQKNQVNVHIIISDIELNVINNIKNKEIKTKKMQDQIIGYVKSHVRYNVKGNSKSTKVLDCGEIMIVPEWLRSDK